MYGKPVIQLAELRCIVRLCSPAFPQEFEGMLRGKSRVFIDLSATVLKRNQLIRQDDIHVFVDISKKPMLASAPLIKDSF